MAAMKRGSEKKNSAVTMRRQPLDAREWNFKKVPDNEIEACYLYEYAREFFKTSKQLKKLREEWNNPTKKQSGEDYEAWAKALDLLRTHCKNFPCVNFDFFPKTAWQDLPVLPKTARRNSQVDIRKRAAEEVNEWSERFRKSRFDRLYIVTLRELEPLSRRPHDVLDFLAGPPRQEELTETYALAASKFCNWNFHRPVSEQTEYGLFAINWSHNNSQIKRALAEWLEDQRDERKKLGLPDKKPVSNRGGFRDRLNWLAALRLQQHYPKKELVKNYGDTGLKCKEWPYWHYSDLCEAANRAKNEIARLFSDARNEKEWRRKQSEQDKSPLSLPDFPKE